MMEMLDSAFQNKTILIVDDTPANLGVMMHYLEDFGFEVLLAQDGEEALQRAQFVHPDLILLDVMMPGLDGFETCRRLKAIAAVKEIPVIFMTALTDTKGKVEGFDAGGVDYITKPFQIEEVFARIKTHLRLRLMHRQLHLQNIRLQDEIAERKRLNEMMRIAAMVYENSGEGMLVTDVDNRIVSINPAFAKITGYDLAEVLGKDPNFLSSGRHDKDFYGAMWGALGTNGYWRGELWDRRKDGEIHAKSMIINTLKSEDGALHGYVGLFSDITDKKKSEEMIWRQANFDELTGLPNRRMFGDRLAQEAKNKHRAGLSLALLFIDLDSFKGINDTLGHSAGDQLLVQTGLRITACTRESDTVARLGGDEFTVLLTQIHNSNHVERIAQVILDSLAQPFILGGSIVYVSASIGIALYPADATDTAHLLNNSDQAMYVAKSEGGNRFSYFTPSLQVAAQTRRHLITDLHSALDTGQFRVYFQPIVELATSRVHKAEALVRWQHPVRGIIGPVDFIPLAEETGLIVDIGDWVFRESARWAKRWTELRASGFQVSVNISPVQFKKEGDEQEQAWLDYLAEVGLSGANIVLEITEGLLLDINAKIADKLHRYRGAGIQMAIDDFGTGYSSLSYLKKLDIDYLKIDRSFVSNLATDPDDMALSEAIIVMAHKLGLKVIAEGVETEEQRHLLAAAGCDYAQGYLFSKPIAPEQFERLLQNGGFHV